MPDKKNEETAIEAFIDAKAKEFSIPKSVLKTLQKFGIEDARVLSVLTEAEIATIPSISEKTAAALVRAADEMFRGALFQKATDQPERLRKRRYFTIGSKNLDAILGGGIPTGVIVEIAGEYRTGKTQTCMTCAVTAQLPEEQGGLGRPVIYIDTENSFQTDHLKAIGERFAIKQEELLDNISVVYAEQLRYLEQTSEKLPGYVQALDPGLIIIDSLMAPYRTEFHKLNELAPRQKQIGKLIGLLKRIAIAFNTAVIFTNQVMANISLSGAFNPVKPTGGHVIAHASDIRLFTSKGLGSKRKVRVDDCAWLPPERTEFFITEAGIADVESLKGTKEKKSSSSSEEEEPMDEDSLSKEEEEEQVPSRKITSLAEGAKDIAKRTKKTTSKKKAS